MPNNYFKSLLLLLFLLFNNVTVYSQSIKNENSPQSVNVQGNGNKISYNVFELNDKLLELFLSDKSNQPIDDLIGSLKTDSIPKEVLKDYANGVLDIYRSLYKKSKLVINDTIKSVFNDKSHVFDIGIHTKACGHDITLVFKLLPINYKADFNDLIMFLNALKDIKVAKGIIICNGGFSENIVKYAKKHSIDLCTFKDIESRNWNNDIKIPVIWIESSPLFTVDFNIHLEKEDRLLKSSPIRFFSYKEGNDLFTITDILSYKWENNLIPHVTDSIFLISMKTNNLKMQTLNNNWRKVNKLDIYYTSREIYYLKYFTPSKFKAIENIVTNEVQLKEAELEFEAFQEKDGWVKIGEDIKDDNSPGEITKFPKGIVLLVTTNLHNLSEAGMNLRTNRFRRMD